MKTSRGGELTGGLIIFQCRGGEGEWADSLRLFIFGGVADGEGGGGTVCLCLLSCGSLSSFTPFFLRLLAFLSSLPSLF